MEIPLLENRLTAFLLDDALTQLVHSPGMCGRVLVGDLRVAPGPASSTDIITTRGRAARFANFCHFNCVCTQLHSVLVLWRSGAGG